MFENRVRNCFLIIFCTYFTNNLSIQAISAKFARNISFQRFLMRCENGLNRIITTPTPHTKVMFKIIKRAFQTSAYLPTVYISRKIKWTYVIGYDIVCFRKCMKSVNELHHTQLYMYIRLLQILCQFVSYLHKIE